MSQGNLIHDPNNCYKTSVIPEENKQIVINTYAHPNGSIIIGFYAKGKWYDLCYGEVNVQDIMCWHYQD